MVSGTGPNGLTHALDEASISRFHLRAVLVSGMGFFTDAYDLFVIGIAATLIKQQWQLSSGRLALLNAVMLGAAVLGALVFGRVADLVGRKRVYWLVAVIMVVGRAGLGAGAVLLGTDRVPLRARLRRGRRLSGQRGTDERVRQPGGPRQAGRDGVLHPGPGPDRGPAHRAGPARRGRRPRPGLAHHAGARRGAGRGRDLPAPQDARIAAIPGSGARTARQGRGRPGQLHRWVGEREPGAGYHAHDGPARVPDQPPLAGDAGRHGRLLVPARLRLLRQHDLHSADHRADLAAVVHDDGHRHPASHFRGRGRARAICWPSPGSTGSGTASCN